MAGIANDYYLGGIGIDDEYLNYVSKWLFYDDWSSLKGASEIWGRDVEQKFMARLILNLSIFDLGDKRQ